MNFDHPANARILRHLKRRWDPERPQNLSAPPEVYDLYTNPLGTHPDVAERLWTELTVRLPWPCAWVVYGSPVLVHPGSGVIFGFAGGTLVYALRLPEKARREALAAGAERIHTYSDGTRLALDDIGEEWVFGRWLAQEPDWCLAAYEAAGLRCWEIDLKKLYGRKWKERDRFHLREDLWESPDGDLAGVLYGIAEVGLSKEVGRLAVFRRKEKPELVVHLPDFEWWCLPRAGVQFGVGGLLFAHRFKPGGRKLGVRICAVNVNTKSLCPVRPLEEAFYEVRHIDGMKYGFTRTVPAGSPGEIVIDLRELAWTRI